MTHPAHPPHAPEAERSVLSAIMLGGASVLAECASIIGPDDLYTPAHAEILRAMVAVVDRGEAVDPVTLEDQLRRSGTLEVAGGFDALGRIADSYASAHNAAAHARIIRDAARVREVIQAAKSIAAEGMAGPDDPGAYVDAAEQAMLDAGALAGQSSRTVREVALGVVKSIQDRSRGSGGITGIPTGLSALDDITAGLQAKDLIIVAARPSMGKTALALNMAQGACVDHGVPVLVFSLEMGAEQLVERMICSLAQADQTAVRRGRVAGDEWGEILRAADRVASAPIQIDDTPAPTIAEMRARARRWRTDRSLFPDGGPGLVVVDYLQLARGSAGQRSREQEISEISRGLKAMAKELDVPVVALSQLNRAVDSRPSHRPMMSDLRESGAIEQDADVIMFIYRAEQYMDDSTPESERAEARGRAEVIVGKQRNGATGTIRATFRARSTTFVDA